MSKLLYAQDITKTFKKSKADVPVLKGVDFSVDEGETVAIVGPSGAGKSTLLQILGTLDSPTTGKLNFYEDGKTFELFKISELQRSEFRNRHMGFVFQFHHLLPEFSALENVMMPGWIAKHDGNTLRERSVQLLKDFGLDHRYHHKPSELSGGECQRVAVARAMLMSPKLIFGDELTGNLDSANSQSLIELLIELNQRTKTTLVIVTHDLKIASKMSRIVEMRDGKLLQSA